MNKLGQLLALGVLLVIIAVSAALIAYTNYNISPKDLSIFVPDEAVFALRISKPKLSTMRSKLSSDNSAMNEAFNGISGHLSALEMEQTLSQTVEQVIWSATMEEDVITPSLIIQFEAKPSGMQLKKLEKLRYEDFISLYSDLTSSSTLAVSDTSLSILKLNPFVYVITPLATQKDYFSRSKELFHASHPVDLYLSASAIKSFDKMLSFISSAAFFSSTNDNLDGLLAYLDHQEGLVRLSMTMQGKKTIDRPVSDFAISQVEDYDLIISHQLQEYLGNELRDPVSVKIQQFADDLAIRYSISTQQLYNMLQPFTSIIIAGDSWLLLGQGSDLALVQSLASNYGSKVTGSTLSDGSTYLEQIKHSKEPELQQIDGYDVSSWLHPDYPPLYQFIDESAVYISTDIGLLRSQLGGAGSGQEASKSRIVQHCLFEQGKRADKALLSGYILVRKSDSYDYSGNIEEFAIFESVLSGTNHQLIACFD